MDSPGDQSQNETPKLGTPGLEPSTKIGMAVFAVVLAYCVLSIWLPSPAGWIAVVAFLYVGLSLALLIVSDLGKLRDDRLLVARAAIEGPTVDDPDLRVMLDLKGLASDRLQRWRAWRKWLGLIAAAVIAILFLATWNGWRVLACAALAVAWLRDLQLAVRLLDALPKSAWGDLSQLERGWLRTHAGFVGLVFLCIWLGVVAIVAYLFSGHIPIRWNTFAFTFFYGALGLAALLGGRRWIALAFRAQPGIDSDKVEVLRMTRESESPYNELDPRDPQ